jgi:exonuclease-1
MIKRCDELLNNANVKRIYIVFDGKRCPLKAVTNIERQRKRTANLKLARELKRQGRKFESMDKYKACLKVEDWMADSVRAAVVKKWGQGSTMSKVNCVFSPYEADAQLAKLCMDGLADAVVTEVSGEGTSYQFD